MNYAEEDLMGAASGASSDEEDDDDDGGGKPRARDKTAAGDDEDDDDDDDDDTGGDSYLFQLSILERIHAFCQLVIADDVPHPNSEIPNTATLFDYGTSKSIIYQNGVRLEWPDAKAKSGKKHRWYCLVGDCAKTALTKKGIPLDATTTKNATAHLTSRHCITAQKTLAAALKTANSIVNSNDDKAKQGTAAPPFGSKKKRKSAPLDDSTAAASSLPSPSGAGAGATGSAGAATSVTPKKRASRTTTTPGFAANPAHSLSLLFATHSVLHGNGQDNNSSYFQSNTWNVLADVIGKKVLANKKEAREQFKNNMIDPRRFVMEQYVFIKEKIMQEIHAARGEFDMPFLSFSMEVLSGSSSVNNKYLGVRVNFMNGGAHFKSYAIGFREFNPAWHERHESKSSGLIVSWIEAIFSEFGIDTKRDVILGSASTRSVVNRNSNNNNDDDTGLMALISEWCIAYRIERALVHSFSAAESMLTKVRKTLDTAYRSETSKVYNEVFRQHQQECDPALVLSKTLGGRDWKVTEAVLHRLLCRWDMIEESYRKDGLTFSLNGCDRAVIGELYSVLHPMRRIQELSQKAQSLIGLELYISLVNAYQNGVLCPPADLKIIDTSTNNDTVETLFGGKQHQGPKTRSEADLDPRTTAVRSKLRQALDSRFYDRFHPVRSLGKNWDQVYGPHATVTVDNVDLSLFKFGYAYEIQAFFHPRFRDQRILKDMCMAVKISESSIADLPSNWRGNNKGHLRLHHYNLVKAAVEKHILKHVTMVALNHVTETSSPSAASTTTPVSRKRRLESNGEEMLLVDAMMVISATTTPQPHSTAVDPPGTGTRIQAMILVEDEMRRYGEAASRLSRAASMSLDKLIHWWHFKQRAKLPCLYQVTMVYFAVNPGSGCCDAGPLGRITTDSRPSSLGPGLAEAELFLRWNRDMVALDSTNVKALPGDQWKAAIPTRPKFPVDYTDAVEAAVDRNDCTDEED